jgi:DNA polymerase III epsilon subunit-like protein
MSYIILDTETSGTGSTDTVLQLAYQCYDRHGELLDEFCDTFRPAFEYEIHEKAQAVHGFTKEWIDLYGKHATLYYRELERLRYRMGQNDLFIGHNIAFDIRMINQDLARYLGVKMSPITVCTMNNSKIKAYVGATDKNNNLKAPNLGELYAKLFGTEIVGAHDALADVRATAKCFFELKRKGVINV